MTSLSPFLFSYILILLILIWFSYPSSLSSQTISGVTLATALTPLFQETSIAIIALITGASAGNVKIVSITAVIGRAKAVRRDLLQSDADGVLMDYTMSIDNGDANSMEASLSSAILSGGFTQALQSTGYTTATAQTVPLVMNLSPTAMPTASPTTKPTGGSKYTYASKYTMIIVGTATGGIACLVVMLYTLILLRRHQRKSRVAVYEQEYEEDLECQAHMTRRIISAENSDKNEDLLLREWSENFDKTDSYLDSRRVSPAKLKAGYEFDKKLNAKKHTIKVVRHDEENHDVQTEIGVS